MNADSFPDRPSVGGPSGISPELLAILVCPVDHGTLEAIPEGLRCTTCQRVYGVRDGIPNMVPDVEG